CPALIVTAERPPLLEREAKDVRGPPRIAGGQGLLPGELEGPRDVAILEAGLDEEPSAARELLVPRLPVLRDRATRQAREVERSEVAALLGRLMLGVDLGDRAIGAGPVAASEEDHREVQVRDHHAERADRPLDLQRVAIVLLRQLHLAGEARDLTERVE